MWKKLLIKFIELIKLLYKKLVNGSILFFWYDNLFIWIGNWYGSCIKCYNDWSYSMKKDVSFEFYKRNIEIN